MLLGPIIDQKVTIRIFLGRLTEYPKKVGLHPVKIPRKPSALPIFPQASRLPLYIFESTWRRHLTRSSGVTAVCVRPYSAYQPLLPLLADRRAYTGHKPSECASSVVLGRVKLYFAGLLLCLRASFHDLSLSFFAQGIGFALGIFGDVPY